MSIKDNIRERRRRKLQQLASGHPQANRRSSDLQAVVTEAHLPPLAEEPGTGTAWRDPEFAWKHSNPWSRMDHKKPPEGDWEQWTSGSAAKRWMVRIVVSTLLFAGGWGIFQSDQPWALSTQNWLRSNLTEHVNFDRIAAWYDDKFSGSPSFIPSFGSEKKEDTQAAVNTQVQPDWVKPVDGRIVIPFETTFQGVKLETDSEAQIEAAAEGRVIYAGDHQSGYSVIIQHAGGYKTVYSWMASVQVQKNDWVKAGDPIGSTVNSGDVKKSYVYFAMKAGEVYQNPADVMNLD